MVALILRLVPILLTHGLGIGLDDMFQYDMLARSLASGNGFRWYEQEDLKILAPYVDFDLTTAKGYDPEHGVYTSFRAPLYPLFLSIVYFFSGTDISRFFDARLAQVVLLGAPLAPLTYFIAKQLSPHILLHETKEECRNKTENVAKSSAWIVAFYPMLLVYTLGLGTENLFFILLLLSFLFLLRSNERPTTFHFLFSGIFLALTSLTRSVILLFGGMSLFYLMYLHRKKAWLAGFAFILTIAPWIIRNSLLHNKLTGIETSMGYNLYLGYHPQGNGSFIFGPSLDLLTIMDDAERDEVGARLALDFIREQPERFVPLAINRLGFFFGLEKRVLMYFYGNNLLGYISRPLLLAIAAILLLPFMAVSVLAALDFSLFRSNSQTILLLLLFIFYLLPHVFILSEDRFHLALIPFFAILSAQFWAVGFRAISARWHESNRGKAMIVIALLSLCLLFLNWGFELSRDGDKIAALLGPNGNKSYFPY